MRPAHVHRRLTGKIGFRARKLLHDAHVRQALCHVPPMAVRTVTPFANGRRQPIQTKDFPRVRQCLARSEPQAPSSDLYRSFFQGCRPPEEQRRLPLPSAKIPKGRLPKHVALYSEMMTGIPSPVTSPWGVAQVEGSVEVFALWFLRGKRAGVPTAVNIENDAACQKDSIA